MKYNVNQSLQHSGKVHEYSDYTIILTVMHGHFHITIVQKVTWWGS